MPSWVQPRARRVPTSRLRFRTYLTVAAREIARLGLEREMYELEVFGLTVVSAQRTGAAELCQRAFVRACELIAARSGTYPAVETGSTHVDVMTPRLHHLLHEDAALDAEIVKHRSDRAFLLAALETHFVTEARLDELSANGLGTVLAVARNPRTRSDTLARIYRTNADPSYFFQALALHPNTPVEHLQMAADAFNRTCRRTIDLIVSGAL